MPEGSYMAFDKLKWDETTQDDELLDIFWEKVTDSDAEYKQINL